jgi:hypothetical protein
MTLQAQKCISNLNTAMSTLGDPGQKWFII